MRERLTMHCNVRARLIVCRVKLIAGVEDACALMAQRDEVKDASVENEVLWIELNAGIDDFSFVAETLVGKGYKVLTIREEEVLLEDAFLRLTDGFAAQSAEAGAGE